MPKLRYDIVNYWSEVKLDIIRDYAKEYSRILDAQPRLYHIYIDAFAGAGRHVSKTTEEFIPGSPLNALHVKPPFKEYHLIDLDGNKADALRDLAANRSDVYVYEGDCNKVLIDTVFPRARYEDFRRALCLLDPYGLHLNWDVIYTAGQIMKSVDIFLNFPVMDMNRNVLWRNPDKVDTLQKARMDAFWGDDSWRQAAYQTDNLFAFEEKTDNYTLVQAFRKRLMTVAGFKYVPEPMPMRNSIGAVIYYLFFASMKPVADRIVTYIFNKYREKGAS